MPRKIRELRKELRKSGFVEDKARGKGDHRLWFHPDFSEAFLFLDGAPGDDAQQYQEKDLQAALRKVRGHLNNDR